jgi:hypothetical protein
LRGAGKLYERREPRLITIACPLCGTSLSPQPNRPPIAAMDSSSCGAHAYMLGAPFGRRVAEDGHLTHLTAHAALRRMGARHLKSGSCVAYWVGCCCCRQPNACKCHRGLQGPCIERGPCVDYSQGRALMMKIYPNRGPTKCIFGAPSGNKKKGQPSRQTFFTVCNYCLGRPLCSPELGFVRR